MSKANHVEQWSQIGSVINYDGLLALDRVWNQEGTLTPQEETYLKTIHDQLQFGQPNFQIWVKQTLRQIQENAASKGYK